MRTRALVYAVALMSAALTGLIVALPDARFAHRSPELHVALQSAEAVIALIAAFLIFGRVRRRRRLDDLLLSGALLSLAVANLAFGAVPAVLANETSVFATWSGQITRLVGSALFAAAALAPAQRMRFKPRQEARLILLLLALLAGVAGLVAIFEEALPRGVETVAEESVRPRLDGHIAILGAQALGFVLYTIAAVGFTRRAERTGDILLRWLAIGAVLAAAARLNYVLYPSLFTDYFYIGDLFRFEFYVVIMVAAAAEIQSYWRRLAATAALEERRRISRDLHDGIAQELASIQRNLRWLDEDDRFVSRALASAERALSQARRAIVALDEGEPPEFADALTQTVQRVAEREGAQVILDVDDGARLDDAEREALILIASEALTNAARHAGSDVIRVEFADNGRPVLRVRDFGVGFDPVAAADGGRHGLVSMAERAEAIGATLHVRSEPGRGTEIEVKL